MRIKNVILLSLSLLIFISFSAVVISPASWNICIPDGCSFEKSDCSSISCKNETLAQHLSERSQILHVPIEFQGLIILAFASVLLFTMQKYDKTLRLVFAKLHPTCKLFKHPDSNLFNYLIELFSQGILNPKTY